MSGPDQVYGNIAYMEEDIFSLKYYERKRLMYSNIGTGKIFFQKKISGLLTVVNQILFPTYK